MPKPIEFPEQNKILTAPKGKEEEVLPMAVFAQEDYTISCWELTDDEILEIYNTKKIWLWVMAGGKTQPPVLIDSKSPFEPLRESDA